MRTPAAFLSIGVLASLAALVFAGTPITQQPEAAYVGMKTCETCHAGIASTYAKVGMARTFDRIGNAPRIEDWTRNNRFYHKKSDQHFEMSARDGRFFQKRYKLDAQGRQSHVLEREIHFALGSGNKERDYIHRSESGVLTQLPVVWYSDEKAWGMSPGYDHEEHDGFSRVIDYSCYFCHNAYPKLPPERTRYEAQLPVFPEELANGIDCERCHGPGSAHVDAASNARSGDAVRSAIVNPARLGRKLQMDVCMQCHLETTSVPLPNAIVKEGMSQFGFKPGMDLERFAVHFDFPDRHPRRNDFNIVHQAYRLRQSQCFLQSEMTCTTCHDPHNVPEDKPAFFNAKCAGCHAGNHVPIAQRAPRIEMRNCVTCHMPQRRTDDVVHDVMTDHFIQRRAPAQPLAMKPDPAHSQYVGNLKFYFDETEPEFYMGLGLARGANVGEGVRLLERALQRRPVNAGTLFELASAQQKLGNRPEAIKRYREAIETDRGFAEAHYNLGLALLASGQRSEAIAAFQRALRLQPALADAHSALATAFAQSGDVMQSVEENLNAVRINPLHTVAWNNLALLYLQGGKPDEAKRFATEALRVNPDDRAAQATLRRIPPGR